ncbi:MAG: AgmX/PglI C-terminal domain-containing protein [Polyangiaceae bacterium]|nr:AgmX/PglI C-terminal domain-containing protein [Polyangiaceae bacterium]
MVSTSPPPVKGSGSGAFMAAAAVMILLILGLLYWKLSSGKAEAPATEAPKTPVQTGLPKMAEPPPPPPPPPPEETPDAGPEPGTAKKAQHTGPSGCSGPCGGDSSEVQVALAGRARQAQGCYERALRQNAMLEGQVRVSVRIAPSGAVCSANVVADQLGDSSVSSCVVQRFRASSFPPPKGGCMDAQVPINFKAKR